jgi:hypothetical protein
LPWRVAAAGARKQRSARRRATHFRFLARHLLGFQGFSVVGQERVASPVRVGDGNGVDRHAQLILRRIELVGRNDAVELRTAQGHRVLRRHVDGAQQKARADEDGPLDAHDVLSLHTISVSPMTWIK